MNYSQVVGEQHSSQEESLKRTVVFVTNRPGTEVVLT